MSDSGESSNCNEETQEAELQEEEASEKKYKNEVEGSRGKIENKFEEIEETAVTKQSVNSQLQLS